MASQELNLEKKKRGRPAIGRGEQVNAMLRPEVAEALDKASSHIEDSPSRSELIRRIVVEWLTSKGYLKSDLRQVGIPSFPKETALGGP